MLDASRLARSWVAVAAIWATLLSVSAAPARAVDALPVKPDYDSIVAQFVEVAFGHEHGLASNVVQKWSHGPSLALFTVPDYDIRAYVPQIAKHIDAIKALTGVQVEAGDPRSATLRLGFYPRADFAKMPGKKDDPEFQRWVSTSACVAVSVMDGKQAGAIRQGAIAIGIDIPESQRQHCILEEMIQVLGLPNDACHYRPSLFCEDDRVFDLTPADAILLRTLYDSRLRAGMGREQAMPIVRTIIAELLPEISH